jgi:hypothetical protein
VYGILHCFTEICEEKRYSEDQRCPSYPCSHRHFELGRSTRQRVMNLLYVCVLGIDSVCERERAVCVLEIASVCVRERERTVCMSS